MKSATGKRGRGGMKTTLPLNTPRRLASIDPLQARNSRLWNHHPFEVVLKISPQQLWFQFINPKGLYILWPNFSITHFNKSLVWPTAWAVTTSTRQRRGKVCERMENDPHHEHKRTISRSEFRILCSNRREHCHGSVAEPQTNTFSGRKNNVFYGYNPRL